VLCSAVVDIPVRESVTGCCARAAGVTTAMRSACESRERCTAQKDDCAQACRREFSHCGPWVAMECRRYHDATFSSGAGLKCRQAGTFRMPPCADWMGPGHVGWPGGGAGGLGAGAGCCGCSENIACIWRALRAAHFVVSVQIAVTPFWAAVICHISRDARTTCSGQADERKHRYYPGVGFHS
jgi:hypothetical protein